MARVANSMVTFQDLDDMVSFEGFSYVTNPITPPSNLNTCATKLDVLGYLDVDLTRNIADNQLVSYSIIVPPAITDELTISPTSRTVNSSEQGDAINVISNTSWTISESLSWASVNTSSGSGNETVFLTVIENTSNSSRTGTITFTTGQVTATHTITQEGANSGTKNF